MPPIALPTGMQDQGHAEAHTPFSLLDTLHTAISSCTPSFPSISIPGPSACLPCLRTVPSDDSLNQHLNPEPQPRRNATSANNTTRRDGPRGSADASWTPNPDGSSIPRARPDELQGLLASHSSSSFSDDDDVERVSMHSNFGRNRRKGRKEKEKKRITLFGFDLFGAARRKEPAPITLGEEDDVLYTSLPDHTHVDHEGSSRRGGEGPSSSTPSLGTIRTSATFDADSDAALLSASAIDEFSTDPTLLAQSIAFEEQRLLQKQSEKEERRRKRRERREGRHGGKEGKETRDALERERLKLERAKMQGVLPEEGEGEEFEGFQGSGSAVPAAGALILSRRSRSGTSSSRTSGTTSRTGESGSRDGGRREGDAGSKGGEMDPGARVRGRGSNDNTGEAKTSAPPTPSSQQEDFGDFVSVESNGPEEGEADEVDLDGELYAGPRRSYAEHRSARGSSSNSGSNPRVGAESKGSGGGSQSHAAPKHAHRRTMSRGTSSSHGHAPASPSPLGPGPTYPSDLPLPLPTTVTTRKETKDRKSKSSSSKKSSRSSGSTSQSTSVASPSPLSPTFAEANPLSPTFAGEEGKYVSPSTVEQGLGFFDAEDFGPSHTPSPNPSYVPSANPSYTPSPHPSIPPPSPFAGSFAASSGRARATSVVETGSGGSSRDGSRSGSGSGSGNASKRGSRSGSVVGVRQGVVGERRYAVREEGGEGRGDGEGEGARGKVGGEREVGARGKAGGGREVEGRGRGGSESGFPSTGFGGPRRGGGERRDMVRFLSGGEGL